ncbi:MAG: hypothetical protein HY647_13430 [Acidobacteria bacterium]|nr:hypothetical protein [Acidobacteriota bacterium]
MDFIVGGYDEGDAYGKVFLIEIPRSPDPAPRNPDPEFGMTWGGQLEILSRIIHGFDPAIPKLVGERLSLATDKIDQLAKGLQQELEFPIPWGVLPLQDCVDLAAFAIRATMTLQRLAVGVRGVGGPIDVAVITRTQKLDFVQKKELHGELGANER